MFTFIIGHVRPESLKHYNSIPNDAQKESLSIALQTRKSFKRPIQEPEIALPKSKSTHGMPLKKSKGLGLMPMPVPRPMLVPRQRPLESFLYSQTPSTSQGGSQKFTFKTPKKNIQPIDLDSDIEDEFIQDENVCTQEPRKIVVSAPAQEPSQEVAEIDDNKENHQPAFAQNSRHSTMDRLLFVLNREQDINEMRLNIMKKITEKM